MCKLRCFFHSSCLCQGNWANLSTFRAWEISASSWISQKVNTGFLLLESRDSACGARAWVHFESDGNVRRMVSSTLSCRVTTHRRHHLPVNAARSKRVANACITLRETHVPSNSPTMLWYERPTWTTGSPTVCTDPGLARPAPSVMHYLCTGNGPHVMHYALQLIATDYPTLRYEGKN